MLSILLIGVSETGGAEKNKTWARFNFCRKCETKTSTCLSHMPFCPFLHLITTKCSWSWFRVLKVIGSEISHLLSRMVMLQYFSNLVLICLFVKIVPKRPLLMSVCHVCHNQRGIERHSCLEPCWIQLSSTSEVKKHSQWGHACHRIVSLCNEHIMTGNISN